MQRPLLCLILAASACSSSEPEPTAPTQVDLIDAARLQPVATTPAVVPPTPPPPPAGCDYADQVKTLFRVAACGSDAPLAEIHGQRIVAKHCAKLERVVDRYRKGWTARAKPFIANLRPPDLPGRVVYPFGGGDLSTALATFPDATEITTISLEAAGDPRTIDKLSGDKLAADLAVVSEKIGRLYAAAHSTTRSLQTASHSKLPGTLMFALVGLAVHGFEPVSLRYFTIVADGSLHYLSESEIAAAERDFAKRHAEHRAKEGQKKKLQVWKEQLAVFANMELGFREAANPAAPVRTYRHIVANLDNAHLAERPGLIAHLTQKREVAVMTKAASFLLWMADFSTIRDYLLANMVWMISDASGIPPAMARAAGFEQITYGRFAGPYFYYTGRTSKPISKSFIKLWEDNPVRKLPFRYGYPDSTKKGNHLMITRPAR